MTERPDYYLCVCCGHEKVLNKNKDEHEQSQDHQDFSRLNFHQHQLGTWTIEDLKDVRDRLTEKIEARKEE